ncbi:hypothetical protein P154DRAFT_243989 [Amniculicola lignicola CBS 123094]|uniref:Uncharacterized protein n=1 Tax=Amniculicola lignicola CBS 123094 TaxID=1392246 RepID=A0A6A5WD97_9PLEO|nr:hypothetical protein P154DRAFT_243989 [Amniculicola lignicola CBS 123094]
MPPLRHQQANSSLRVGPYPIDHEADKENAAPVEIAAASQSPQKKAKRPANKEPDRSNLPSNYLDIELEEIDGEIPAYENTSLAEQIRKAAQNCSPVETTHGLGNQGPSVNSLLRFLKKSGAMGGGDTDSYYFGNVLLEKLRIWNQEKKTAAREKAEKEYVISSLSSAWIRSNDFQIPERSDAT